MKEKAETLKAETLKAGGREDRRNRLGFCGARLGFAWGMETFLQRASGEMQWHCRALANADKTEEPALGIVTTLLNRQPDGEFEFPKDNWYLIAPLGDHPHTESGFVQVVDADSVAAMANSAAKGKELLVDFDHESWDNKKRTTAAGWIQNLEARLDGLWAQIRWSGSGKTALKNGDYRFISPVWTFANCQQIDETHVRPLTLSDAGLTNRPNLQGLPALSNREETRPQLAAEQADQQKESMKKLNTELGLAADASEESALAEITKLKNRASEAEGKLQPLEASNTELKNSNRSLLEAQVESDLDTAGLEGDTRETFKGQLLANRAGTLPLLAELSKAKGNAQANALTNRAGAKTPGDKKGGSTGGGSSMSRQQEIDDAVANAKGESFEQRFENARRTNPGLFQPEEAEE